MKIKSFLLLLLFLANINISFSSEIKIIAYVGNKIITNEDIKKEIIILKYLLNISENDTSINQIALNNLIEINIKEIEIKNKLISIEESLQYLNLVLKKNNKKLEEFYSKFDKSYQEHLKNKIQIEISWNRLIVNKFSDIININLDEIISSYDLGKNNSKKIDNLILMEKNKKLQSISNSYFNDIKNQILIKFL